MTSRRTNLRDVVDKAYQDAAALGFGIGRDEQGLPTIARLPGEGHNSTARDKAADASGDDRLRLLIERIERLEEEKAGIGDDIKDVYGEGKAVGYDTKMMRKIVALRKMDPAKRREEELLLETYKCALGIE